MTFRIFERFRKFSVSDPDTGSVSGSGIRIRDDQPGSGMEKIREIRDGKNRIRDKIRNTAKNCEDIYYCYTNSTYGRILNLRHPPGPRGWQEIERHIFS